MLYSKFHKYISHDLIIMGDFNILTNDPKPSQLNILINQLGLTLLKYICIEYNMSINMRSFNADVVLKIG